MSNAQTGLRNALARGASGSVLAIGEMSASDILAGMNDDQKVAMAAAFAQAGASSSSASVGAASSDPEPDPNDGDEPAEGDKCSECSEPMKDGKCQKCSPDSKASASAGERDRIKAVAAAVETDAACSGKAGLALAMLADDDFASLSASGIVKLLGKTPLPGASTEDPEAAAGAAMFAAMKALGNPDTGNASTSAQPQQQANHGWDKIHAEIRERRGR